MSGKKGRSGRVPRQLENQTIKYIDDIKHTVQKKLSSYLRYIAKIDNVDLTDKQVSHLVTLSMKHTPEDKDSSNNALDVLTKLALEGAKEYARVKAMRPIDLHTKVINDIDCEAEVEGDA